MSPAERIDRLDRAIRELRIEFEKFFNGARQAPPEEQREEIRLEIRALRNANLRGLADTYRLSQLEARFVSLGELFTRRLRQVEEGRVALPSIGERQHRPDALRGVVIGAELDPGGVEALYAGLAGAPGGAPAFDLESFRAYLARQLGSIREKTGCERVRFRLEPEGERLKLKAKPLRPGAG